MDVSCLFTSYNQPILCCCSPYSCTPRASKLQTGRLKVPKSCIKRNCPRCRGYRQSKGHPLAFGLKPSRRETAGWPSSDVRLARSLRGTGGRFGTSNAPASNSHPGLVARPTQSKWVRLALTWQTTGNMSEYSSRENGTGVILRHPFLCAATRSSPGLPFLPAGAA